MPRRTKTYRRLPGRGTTLTSYVKLYAGPDHLLQVFSTGYSETYKRFFYRDIQAVIIQKTSLHVAYTAVAGTIGLMIALPAIAVAASDEWVGATILFGLASIGFAIALLNLVRGPTCACYVKTPVQTEKLVTIRRTRRAHRFLNRLRPLVESAQGLLTPDELARRGVEWEQVSAFEAAHPPSVRAAPGTSPAPAAAPPPASTSPP